MFVMMTKNLHFTLDLVHISQQFELLGFKTEEKLKSVSSIQAGSKEPVVPSISEVEA